MGSRKSAGHLAALCGISAVGTVMAVAGLFLSEYSGKGSRTNE